MSTALLPPNATAYERRMAVVCALAESVDVAIIRDIHNPQKCPVALLPWLAWARSVEYWRKDWPEATKRAVIDNAFFVHRHKGTRAAIKRALSPLLANIVISEWFDPGAADTTPGTWRIDAMITERGLSDAAVSDLNYLIGVTAPVSRPYTLNLSLGTLGRVNTALAIQLGERTTIHPYVPETIVPPVATAAVAAAGYGNENTTIYPEHQ